MVCAAAHAAPPRGSCQMASLAPWTARASQPPAEPGASVAVPGGRAGSGRHAPAGPVMACARFPVSTTAMVLPGNRAQAITGPAGAWRPLPALPPGTATLAPGSAGGWDALAVHGARLAIWQLPRGGAAWAAAQTINVPIAFGSSG